MCLRFWMEYEFNNWRAFYRAIEFVKKRHPKNYPIYEIQVPVYICGSSWLSLDGTVAILKDYEPENLEEMSIYGKIKFDVSQDENLAKHL